MFDDGYIIRAWPGQEGRETLLEIFCVDPPEKGHAIQIPDLALAILGYSDPGQVVGRRLRLQESPGGYAWVTLELADDPGEFGPIFSPVAPDPLGGRPQAGGRSDKGER